MLGFGKRQRPAGGIRLHEIEDPLAIVPAAAPGVQSREGEHGWLTLRMGLRDRGRMERFCSRYLGMRRGARLNLDEVGTAFWRLINGKRSLREVARRLSESFALDAEASRRATIQFTRELLVRGFITIRLQQGTGEEQQTWRAT